MKAMEKRSISFLSNYLASWESVGDKRNACVGATASMCASACVYAHAGLSNTRVMCAYPHKSTRKQAYMHEAIKNQN